MERPGRVEGKVALISGGARGMGAEDARLLVEEGAKVVIGDILDDEGKALADEIGESARYVHLDVTQPDQWDAAVATAIGEFGKLNVLVNNAGTVALGQLRNFDLAKWQRVIDVNLTGTFLGMRAVVDSMTEAGSGSIINVSSIWGNAAVPGAHAYHATKGAVRNMSKSAAISYAKDNVRVNSVHPGFIKTPLTDAQEVEINDFVVSQTPMGRAGLPEEIANGVVFLASDEASFVTGSELVIDGGYLAQ